MRGLPGPVAALSGLAANQLATSQESILSAQCWSSVYPLVSTIPVDWDYKMPYGLIYAKDPPQEVLQFIMAVGQMGSE